MGKSTVTQLLQFYSFRAVKPEFTEFDSTFGNEVHTPKELLHKTSKRDQFVWFYADWCGFCKVVIPEWKKLMKKKFPNCDVLQVNCDNNPAIRKYMGEKVQGFPTFLYIDKKFNCTDFNEFAVKFGKDDKPLPRTAENFAKFIESKS